MSEDERSRSIRRIVVALDASRQSQVVLEAAAELAARLGADLVGLFIEDTNLLNLASSPFGRELSRFSATPHQMQSEQLERQLRIQASQLRRALAAAADRQQVSGTLRVVRGQIVPELVRAAAESDLIILGRADQSLARQRRLGNTARGFLAQTPCLTLLWQTETRLGPPVLAVYDGSAVAQRALALAAQLVQTSERALSVILVAEAQTIAQELQQTAATWLQTQALTATYRWLSSINLIRLAQLVAQERGSVVVLPRASAWAQNEALLALLDEIRASVLVVQ